MNNLFTFVSHLKKRAVRLTALCNRNDTDYDMYCAAQEQLAIDSALIKTALVILAGNLVDTDEEYEALEKEYASWDYDCEFSESLSDYNQHNVDFAESVSSDSLLEL